MTMSKPTIAAIVVAAIAIVVWCGLPNRIPPEPPDQVNESVNAEYEGRATQWPTVRANHVAKYPRCAACGSGEALNVHHIEPFHERPDLELDPANLITLCRRHHFEIGHDPDGPWRPQRPDWTKSNSRVIRDASAVLRGEAY